MSSSDKDNSSFYSANHPKCQPDKLEANKKFDMNFEDFVNPVSDEDSQNSLCPPGKKQK
jgi:hypothetical protein